MSGATSGIMVDQVWVAVSLRRDDPGGAIGNERATQWMPQPTPVAPFFSRGLRAHVHALAFDPARYSSLRNADVGLLLLARMFLEELGFPASSLVGGR